MSDSDNDSGSRKRKLCRDKGERERIFHTNREGERKRESPEKEALKGDLFRGASFHFGPGCMLSGTSMDAFSIST